MTSDDNKDYWDGYEQGIEDGPGGGMARDVGEQVVETMSLGMISRSDDEKAGIADGREGLHEED